MNSNLKREISPDIITLENSDIFPIKGMKDQNSHVSLAGEISHFKPEYAHCAVHSVQLNTIKRTFIFDSGILSDKQILSHAPCAFVRESLKWVVRVASILRQIDWFRWLCAGIAKNQILILKLRQFLNLLYIKLCNAIFNWFIRSCHIHTIHTYKHYTHVVIPRNLLIIACAENKTQSIMYWMYSTGT